MSTSTATTTFAPAEQLTFRPRTIAEATPEPAVRRHLVAVPSEPGYLPPAEALASVHRLPVAHRNEVYRRRRLVALALLVGVVIGIVSFMGSADATPTPEGQLAESVTVVVQPGDTLWAIASDLDPDGDPRALVDRLVGLAGSSSLQPGQQLIIPGHWLG